MVKHLDNFVVVDQSEKLNQYFLQLFCPNFEGIIVSTFNLRWSLKVFQFLLEWFGTCSSKDKSFYLALGFM